MALANEKINGKSREGEFGFRKERGGERLPGVKITSPSSQSAKVITSSTAPAPAKIEMCSGSTLRRKMCFPIVIAMALRVSARPLKDWYVKMDDGTSLPQFLEF